MLVMSWRVQAHCGGRSRGWGGAGDPMEINEKLANQIQFRASKDNLRESFPGNLQKLLETSASMQINVKSIKIEYCHQRQDTLGKVFPLCWISNHDGILAPL